MQRAMKVPTPTYTPTDAPVESPVEFLYVGLGSSPADLAIVFCSFEGTGCGWLLESVAVALVAAAIPVPVEPVVTAVLVFPGTSVAGVEVVIILASCSHFMFALVFWHCLLSGIPRSLHCCRRSLSGTSGQQK